MIPYTTVVIASAIGVLPVAAWTWAVIRYNRKHPRGINFFMNVFFFGVLSAVPASILEIFMNERDSNSQIIEAMQNIWAFKQGSAMFAAIISAIIIAIIEEFSKGVCMLIPVLSRRFRVRNDGLIVGGLVGLAFAVTENGVYFANAMGDSGSEGLPAIVILRFLLSTSAHIVYSSIFGYFLAKAALERDTSKKMVNYACLFLPVLIHSSFNLLLSTSLSSLVVLIIVAGMYFLWYLFEQNDNEVEPGTEV